MRLKINIPESLHRRLKIRAATEGYTVRDLILRAIHRVLDVDQQHPHKCKSHLPLIRSSKPGALRLDNARIYNTISFP
jgi:hypothetical protein